MVVDANHPATHIARSTSQRLIQLPGLRMETAVRAIMTLYPLDGGYGCFLIRKGVIS